MHGHSHTEIFSYQLISLFPLIIIRPYWGPPSNPSLQHCWNIEFHENLNWGPYDQELGPNLNHKDLNWGSSLIVVPISVWVLRLTCLRTAATLSMLGLCFCILTFPIAVSIRDCHTSSVIFSLLLISYYN